MSAKEAAEIVDSLGGPSNVESLTHCATRLRFNLRDASAVDKETVEAIPVVMGAVPQSGDRYQVVIGGAVQAVYNDIMALPSMGGGAAAADPDSPEAIKARERAKGPRGKTAWLDSLFEFLSDSFRPIIGALLGASLFITFMALMATLGVIPAWNAPPETGVAPLEPSWQFINLMWQCVFIFLPLMVAYNASKKVGADPWVGFAVMAVVMLPGFSALGQNEAARSIEFLGQSITVIDIFGLPLTIFDYASQVFPPLLMAAVLGPLWKLLRKIFPENVQLIFVPFFAMLIMIPLTSFLIGPIGYYAGAGLANVLSAVNDFSPFIFAIVIPLAYPFMVPLGLHWPINAVMLLNIQTLGYDYIQGPMGAWNFACFGATAGVLWLAWRERDAQMKQTATGALAAGLFGGISEPSLYGIHLRFKRIYPRMLVGCFVGGLIIGIGGGVTTNAFVFTSLLTIPAFDSVILYGIAVLSAFVVAMALVILSGYKDPKEAKAAAAAGVTVEELENRDRGESAEDLAIASTTRQAEAAGITSEVMSPLAGEAVPLSEVPDPVFGGEVMGPGVAIKPSGNTVYSPGAGTVAAAQPTGHAFGLLLDSGVEVLIHVGIDTVNLDGEGFDVKVKSGDRIEVGTELVTFDRAVIEKAGYPLITPVVILNADDFGAVDTIVQGAVEPGVALLRISPKTRSLEAGM